MLKDINFNHVSLLSQRNDPS